MSETELGDQELDKFAEAIGDTMAYVANEAVLLARMEDYLNPKPARLWNDGEEDYFNKKLDKAVEHMGGPPRLILLRVDDPPPECDPYPEAALRGEWGSVLTFQHCC